MPTKIGPQNVSLYGGIFALFASIGVSIASIYFLALCLLAVHINYKMLLMAGLFLFVVGAGFVKIVSFAFSEPFWAIVDDDLKTLEFKYLFKKSRIIRKDHIVAYEDADVEERGRSNSINYSGFSLQLLGGTKILISERGLDDVFYLKSMLDYWGVKKLEGHEHYDV